MPRLSILAALVAAALALVAPLRAADAPAPAPAADKVAQAMPVDDAVRLFNPRLLYSANNEALPRMESMFTAPASDIARLVHANAWFTALVFMPFLVLPIIMLLIVMFRFRDRGDGRKPATFMHNARLENIWTAIPILTLFIVAVPVYPLLYHMESPPPKTDLLILITGKQFAWDYEYQREAVSIGTDPVSQQQEPLVLMKDKTVSLNITSSDVNHAWWVPAFGVKKDAIRGRYTHAWFTPDRAGFFKGQCAELCGPDHGMMVIDAVVVEPAQFALYLDLQRNRMDTNRVWTAFSADTPAPAAAEQLKPAIAKYLSNEKQLTRRAYALRYWIASNCESYQRRAPVRATRGGTPEEIASFDKRSAAFDKDYADWQKACKALDQKRKAFEQLLGAALADLGAAEADRVADTGTLRTGATP